MSLLCVSSDWHPDKKTSGVDRYDDVAEAVAQTVRAARQEKADLYLMLGDLCDPDDGPAALRAVALAISTAMELAGAGIPSVWVPGNHDVVEDGSGRSTLSPLEALDVDEVVVLDRPSVVAVPGKPRVSRGFPAQLLALPYAPVSHAYDPAEYVRKCGRVLGDQVVVAGHMTRVDGAVPGEETSEMARGRDVRFPVEECDARWLLLNGHYHEGQVLEAGGRRVLIPGALARFTHGEERNRPRYLLVEV